MSVCVFRESNDFGDREPKSTMSPNSPRSAFVSFRTSGHGVSGDLAFRRATSFGRRSGWMAARVFVEPRRPQFIFVGNTILGRYRISAWNARRRLWAFKSLLGRTKKTHTPSSGKAKKP